MNISHFSSWNSEGGLLDSPQTIESNFESYNQNDQQLQNYQQNYQQQDQQVQHQDQQTHYQQQYNQLQDQQQQPAVQSFKYQFCPNKVNPYHSCGEYCLQKYWPGNRRYRFNFCPNQNSHYCDIRCAQNHGPKDVQLAPNQFAQVQDPNMRHLIYCLMYYGY